MRALLPGAPITASQLWWSPNFLRRTMVCLAALTTHLHSAHGGGAPRSCHPVEIRQRSVTNQGVEADQAEHRIWSAAAARQGSRLRDMTITLRRIVNDAEPITCRARFSRARPQTARSSLISGAERSSGTHLVERPSVTSTEPRA